MNVKNTSELEKYEIEQVIIYTTVYTRINLNLRIQKAPIDRLK